jgi:putative phosphoesterase
MTPYRVGVVSDTHVATGARHPRRFRRNEVGPEQMDRLLGIFMGVDIIIHCGDVYNPVVLDVLELQAPVLCVQGNGDHEVKGDRRVSETLLMDVDGQRVGAIHAFEFDPAYRPFEVALARAFGNVTPNVLLCGDTHIPMIVAHAGVLLVNPGSPTLPFGLAGPGTIALVEIGPGAAVHAELVRLHG